MNRALAVLYLAALIDAIGVGLIIPILPALLRHLAGDRPIAVHYGALISTFALMQFLCAPVLGALSDRFGRRPILLLSLAGGAADYLLTGFAGSLWVLYLARVLGGVTAANMAVISATIADLTPEADRARRYGTLNAVMGIGWIAGPILGGSLGQIWLALPFLAAAGLNGLNLLLAWFLLPEPDRLRDRSPLRLSGMNAFSSLRRLGSMPLLLPMIGIYCVMCLVGQIPMSIWVLYGQARYGWTPLVVGWSFACYGLLFALSQAFLTGPLTRRMGEGGTILLGMVLDAGGYALMGLATRGWMPFAIMPLLSAGGVGLPALQASLSGAVGPARQGELQGTLSSLANLAGVVGPLLVTLLFAATLHTLPGTVWFVGVAAYVACALLAGSALLGRRTGDRSSE
ncbi:TCR/Tet family MFS transporter [Lichenicola cladoniae]|uniref:TCR/Tet family MFS transporter n=1 Tax=Lichenicola cladoniae TaxID=1484109 RepID=A0A6M8HRH1_9PROT|nr:TCR/Tet family MFS transporter [Lichenicola cladoniae]NPD65957.1 TCR/Tet family MFS transporter [Acetobacteraceae bacterium]QKE91054.1 TCR/Tet family MFS transporter [Lichenicola cladoniae]